MNCLIYSRVSTDEQAENGRSLDDQVKICNKYAKDNQHQIVDVFIDPGKTATNINRPGLQDMLLRCQEDKSIDVILVQDTDRLARNTNDHLQIKALLKKNGVQLISVSQPMVSGDSPESQFVDVMIAGMNTFQSQLTGRKVAKTMEQKCIEGWKPGAANLGYKNDVSEDGKKKIITIDESKAIFVRQAFEMYATGVKSVESIANELYQKGFRSKSDQKVTASRLNSMLQNPFYIGKLKHNGKVYDGNQDKLVDEDIYYACQQNFAIRNHYATRSRKYSYLLRGVVFCGKCGGRVHTDKHTKSSGKVYDYYYCPNCKPYVEVAKIEKEVQEAFKNIKLSQTMTDRIICEAKMIIDQTHSGVDEEKRIFACNRAKAIVRRSNLEDGFLDKAVDAETYKRQHAKLNEEISNYDTEILKLEKDRGGNLEVFEQLVCLSRDVYKTYVEANLQLKKQYLALFWERFELEDGTIKKAVPTKLFQALLSQKSVELSVKFRINQTW